MHAYHVMQIVGRSYGTLSAPPGAKNMVFSLTLTFQYLNEFLSNGNDQGMENILKLSNFSKNFEKRAWDTHNAPKPTIENFEKIENSNFLAALG